MKLKFVMSLQNQSMDTTVDGVGALTFPQKTTIQDNVVCAENHMHCALGQIGQSAYSVPSQR